MGLFGKKKDDVAAVDDSERQKTRKIDGKQTLSSKGCTVTVVWISNENSQSHSMGQLEVDSCGAVAYVNPGCAYQFVLSKGEHKIIFKCSTPGKSLDNPHGDFTVNVTEDSRYFLVPPKKGYRYTLEM